jgi:hypothetical protein
VNLPSSQIQNPDASGGGVTPGQALAGQWGYRIRLDGGATLSSVISLETVGPNSVVNGTVIAPGNAGTWDTATQNLMDANGADTGNPIIGPAFLYVYWCNVGAFSPGLGFSATAPALVNGQWILAGGGPDFLFLGWVQVDASEQVSDTVKNREIANFYNRRIAPLAVTPGYVNNAAATTYFRTGANWTTMTATAADSQVTFIGNGESAVWLEGHWTCLQDLAQNAFGGVGLTATTPLQVATIPSSNALAQQFASAACSYSYVPAANALATASLLCYTNNIAIIWVADFARTGAAADPPATSMRGWCWN